jgi:hypothetical protein
VFSQGIVSLANTLIATNKATIAPDVSADVSSRGFNLVGKRNGSAGWIAGDKTGTVALPLDAKLGGVVAHGRRRVSGWSIRST